MYLSVNSLPNDKILNQSNLKVHVVADDKIIVSKIEICLGRIEHMVGEEENVGYQHFLLFPQCFQSFLFQR